MSLKLSIICVAAILALVAPAAADNSIATVQGEVYKLDSFEPMDNAVVYVNSTPSQSMVAKYGMYSFELEPGNYTITAKYYQNSTVTYSVDDTVNIKNKGNYVHDLLLLPVYSEILMNSSSVNYSKGMNATRDNGFYTSNASYLPVVFTLALLFATSYLLPRRQKKIGKVSHEEKAAHNIKDFSSPANTPEISVKVPDKSSEPGLIKDYQVYTEEFVSVTRQVIETEPKISVNESIIESKFKRLEGEVQAESIEKYPVQEIEIPEPASEDENPKTSLEKPAINPEIDNPDSKKKLLLPSDLQGVMDIIRGQRGRITQKDLCSKLKCSDAKVSLMLADLERRELIERFKKGRGNVVILRDEKH